MRFLSFLGLCLIAMLICGLYGAIHDQFSFTVSSEYFTKFKYYQFGLVDSPLPDRAKAALIGFLATWWMGVPIGIVVGGSGFIHSPASVMFKRTLRAYAVAAIVTLLIGLGGLAYGVLFARHNPADYQWFFPGDLTNPAGYISVAYMHNYGYLGGLIGVLAGLAAQIIQRLPIGRRSLGT